jgi:hypothetical protein
MSISAKSIRAFYDRQVGWRKKFYLYLFCVYLPICAVMSSEIKIPPVGGLLIENNLRSALDKQHIATEVSIYTDVDTDLPIQRKDTTLKELIKGDDKNKVIVLDTIGKKWVYWLVLGDGVTNETRDYVTSTATEQIKSTYRLEYLKELFTYLVASTLLAIIAYIFGVFLETLGKK